VIGLLKIGETDGEKLRLLSSIEASALCGSNMIRHFLTCGGGAEGKPVPLNLALVAHAMAIGPPAFLSIPYTAQARAEQLSH
jgi:hypothetical protein